MITLIDSTTVDIGGQLLKVGTNIDYKPTGKSSKLSIGKIDNFVIAPESDSVWMHITEIEDANNKQYISVAVWKEQYDAGLFTNKTKLIHASNEPQVDDLPF